MNPRLLARLGGWLAGLWAGLMLGIGGIAAPTAFAFLPRADAGRLAARLFSTEATIGVCVGAVLTMVGLQLARDRAERGTGSRFGREMALALLALLSVIVGYYAVQPMMEAALAGNGPLSFAALHGLAGACFLVRLVIGAVLAWLLPRAAAGVSPTASS